MKMKKAFVFSADASAVRRLCSAANALAEQSVAAVLGAKDTAEALTDAANKVLYLGEKDEGYIVESYAGALAQTAKDEGADLVILACGTRDRCIAGRLAVMLDAGVITDVGAVEVTPDGLSAKRNVYGGAAEASIKSGKGVTVLCMSPALFDETLPAAVGELVDAPARPDNNGISFVSVSPKTEETVDLSAAKRVVGIGRGLNGADNLPAVEAFAAKLGAELGCSRPIAEEDKLLARSRYIGVSGAVIRPDVYFACGISGQVQHTVGVKDAKVIIAVNKDAKAPIMSNCDYGIVGDMNKILPQLTELL